MHRVSDGERCVAFAHYIIEHRATVRATAARFGISKSTVHKDVTETLPHINRALCDEVKAVLEQNKSERHLRGGEATRRKYLADGDIAEGSRTHTPCGDAFSRLLPNRASTSAYLPSARFDKIHQKNHLPQGACVPFAERRSFERGEIPSDEENF